MPLRRLAACLILVPCLAVPCRAADDQPASAARSLQPLTRARAAQILAGTSALGDDVTRQMKNLKNPYESAVIDDVSDVLSDSSEWQWYSRDHGVLLAIPVKERLGMLASYSGEKVLADVVRRLLNQNGLGNPPVQVVFLEPHDPAEACGHRLGESIRPLAYASAGAHDSCGCQ